ncbi:MAG TPA: NADH-ubiquinone oxidoreductase-F iron-sulfur binding region domain-containing protein [Gemmataceae bacterium]|jgi:NADH:ubiquinone oxidoreductase subunit F (NADH-binding)|nr:NADH-ubiquinone oxidoreductase-F iron-sulfur binding region domain-containing protein [Gemmataceae bacterium]
MKLLRQLHHLQEIHGYLTEDMLRNLAVQENVPLYRLQGLVSFYPHFRMTPPPRLEVAVCRDMSCWLAGASHHFRRLEDEAKSISSCEVREVSCLGRCDRAPAAAINGLAVALNRDSHVRNWLEWTPTFQKPTPDQPPRWQCDPYETSAGRYGLLRELLGQNRNQAAESAVSSLKESGLRGMGGAGFPTGTKWELVRRESRFPKYVICNADESEPGTFKDRVILAELPHLVIEGMILAGLVTGAAKGILFIRHEYEPERQKFNDEVQRVRKLGLLGKDIQGCGFDFDLDIFVSPGGYILGEETALLEALEDKRGEPRNKPPFPGTHGLFGQPTLINNVETLAFVPGILRRGPAWWNAQGKEGFSGLKFIALSGHVARPGVYEIPVGTTVRELIALGGGMKDGKPLKAFAPGGASSNFLPPSMVDVPLDFSAVAKAGSMLGSGAVLAAAEGTDMLALATNIVRFFRNESCGKCVPCRTGSQKAVEILERVQSGQAERKELNVLPDLGETMTLTSICGLGQVALNPILSVMKYWREEIFNG